MINMCYYWVVAGKHFLKYSVIVDNNSNCDFLKKKCWILFRELREKKKLFYSSIERGNSNNTSDIEFRRTIKP